jgi:hypothetical protein
MRGAAQPASNIAIRIVEIIPVDIRMATLHNHKKWPPDGGGINILIKYG